VPTARLTEIGTDVYVLRYPVLDVNAGLIVGGEVAVVVDTLSTAAQAGQLLAAVREVTSKPLLLVNTHWHFDHCFGNDTLAGTRPGTAIWAHEATATVLRDHGDRLQREWYTRWLGTHPDLAAGLAAVTIRAPDRTVHGESRVDIGGRAVELRHPGRGHTEADLIVWVPDAATLFAGDLVEQGAEPGFDDSFPLDWPDTLAAVLDRLPAGARVVPGHGATVDVEFVRAQHGQLTALSWLIRDGHADGATPDAVAAKVALDRPTALVAVKRGYAELSGRI
jgi:glyoxylase-like metal-dependent hydrolase (beta-lactamase superfamily II)